MSESLKENRHKTTGMFGWLKSKKKANAKTEAENQQALNRARQQTDRILTSFASDIQQSQERSANQLFQHMEDLVRKESLINEKITQLASEFNAEDSQMRKFCDCEKKYVFDKAPVNEARPLTMDDYQPCCYTPLYDAMGFTLTSMRNHVQNIEDTVVVVTIITDGLENASKEYTGAAVKQLVEQLKGGAGRSPIWEPIKTLWRLLSTSPFAMPVTSTILLMARWQGWRRTPVPV